MAGARELAGRHQLDWIGRKMNPNVKLATNWWSWRNNWRLS